MQTGRNNWPQTRVQATAATRLFHAGIDEQLIMKRTCTGHRSIKGVMSYKRTSEEQVEEPYDVLNMGPPLRKRQPCGSAAANTHQVNYFDFSGCTSCTINVQCGAECSNK